MGFIAFIGGLLSAAVSTVGPIIATAADVLLNKLPAAIGIAEVALGTVSLAVSKLGESLGIVPEGERVDELGAKALQDETRAKMEDESTQEYLDYLRNDVQLDEDKYAKMTGEEKLACEALGTTMISKSIEEKTGVEMPPEFLALIAKLNMQYEQVERYINAFSHNGLFSMGEFTRYISNDMSEDEAVKVGSVIKETVRVMTPEMSDADIQREIVEMKREYFIENQ